MVSPTFVLPAYIVMEMTEQGAKGENDLENPEADGDGTACFAGQ